MSEKLFWRLFMTGLALFLGYGLVTSHAPALVWLGFVGACTVAALLLRWSERRDEHLMRARK